MVYNTIICSDNRSAGYFGITLRLDYYCKRPLDIFRILDTVYNLYILGNSHILRPLGKRHKFAVGRFAEAQMELVKVKNAIIQMLNDGPANEDFVPASELPVSSNQFMKFYPYDCTDEQVIEELKKCGYIKLSPQYTPNSIKQLEEECIAKVQAEKKKSDEILNQKRESDNRFNKVQSEMLQKESAIAQLNRELQESKKGKDVSQLIERIKGPVKDLAAILQSNSKPDRIKPSGADTNKGEQRKLKLNVALFIPFFNMCLLIMIGFGLLFYGCSRKTGKQGMIASETVSETQISQSNSGKSSAKSDNTKEIFIDDTAKEDFSTAGYSIDVRGYSRGDLKVGAIYTVTAKQNRNAVNTDLQWEYENAKVTGKSDNSFQPTGTPVIITLSVGGKPVCRRTIPKL